LPLFAPVQSLVPAPAIPGRASVDQGSYCQRADASVLQCLSKQIKKLEQEATEITERDGKAPRNHASHLRLYYDVLRKLIGLDRRGNQRLIVDHYSVKRDAVDAVPCVESL
jgi:hypothetical protein